MRTHFALPWIFALFPALLFEFPATADMKIDCETFTADESGLAEFKGILPGTQSPAMRELETKLGVPARAAFLQSLKQHCKDLDEATSNQVFEEIVKKCYSDCEHRPFDSAVATRTLQQDQVQELRMPYCAATCRSSLLTFKSYANGVSRGHAACPKPSPTAPASPSDQ